MQCAPGSFTTPHYFCLNIISRTWLEHALDLTTTLTTNSKTRASLFKKKKQKLHMNFIHASMRSCISSCYIIIQKWIQTFSQDKCVAQASPMIGIHVMFADTRKSSSGYPFLTTLPLWMVKSCVLLSDNDPLLGNGWVQVMTLFVRIVIDSYAFSLGLATSFDESRPSTQ